jgi:4-amino-4-deoxy-L-arabinose transferase-like glycosyltransferase
MATWFFGVGLASAAFLFYFLTAARDIVVGDTPEFITAAATLGVTHPPGYPLFTMLGYFFTWLPLGSIPFRVNLLAIACDALAVGIVYFTAIRLTDNRLAAALAALILALNPIFWMWSLAAEVFPLNNLLASLLIYLLIAWHEQPERKGLLVGASLLGGLALAHHQTIVLLVPAICLLLWRRRAASRRRPKLIAVCAIAIFAGFLPYAYVPWAAARHPFLNWGNVSSFGDLFALLTRSSYGIGRLTNTAGFMAGSPLQRVYALCFSLGPLMGPLASLGLIWAYRRRRWYFWFSAIAFAGAGIFFVAIANLDLTRERYGLYVLERFFLLPHVILAPLTAMGMLMIAELIASRKPKITAVRIAAGAAFVAVVISVFVNYRKIDQSQNHIARTFAEDIFASVPPGTVLLINGDEIVLPLTYLQAVERMRDDVTLVTMPLLPADWYVRQLKERHRDLIVPFDHYDGQSNGLKALADANQNRSIAVVGIIPTNDKSLSFGYWLYPHGLANTVVPIGTNIGIDRAALDNEELLKRYRPPPFRSIKAKSFETNILFAYALPALRLGAEYEQIGSKQDARKWYQRALDIDPDLPDAREALARLGQ